MQINSAGSEVHAAAEILALFTHDNLIHDRNAAIRAMNEAVRVRPGEARQMWSKWIAEAASSLGLPTKTLDCTIDEALQLTSDGARVVCYREADADTVGIGEWMAVLACHRRKFEVRRSPSVGAVKPMSKRSFRACLTTFAKDGRIRCVAILPHQIEASSNVRRSLSPLKRLWLLLHPELKDIWLVAVFAFVVSTLMLATPMAVEALVNTVAFGRFLQPIFILSATLLTFLGFQAAIRGLQTYVIEIIQRRMFARVAGDLSFRLPRADVESIDGEHVPDLVNRFFDIVTVQKVIATLLLDGLGLVLNTLTGMVVLAFYHPWLLGFDVFLLAAIGLIVFLLGRGAIATAVKESKQKYNMADWLEEIARCPLTFRTDGGAEFAMERGDLLIHEYLTARQRHFRILLRQILFALALQAIASTLLLGLGGWLVVSGELTLGQLVAAELIVTVIVGSFAKIGKHLESFYDLLASIDKLGTLFDIRMERHDGMMGTENSAAASLELTSLSYQFPQDHSAFDALTLRVDPGERIAILGGSGAGKSALFDVIYGLRRPTSGSMTVDGFEPRDLRPDALRNRVAIARGSEILHASIEENVHLHAEHVSISQMRDVLQGIGLLPVIVDLKDGMDTMLSRTGSPLSESQCRLLVLARAAVREPGLLLVDGVLDGLGTMELDTVLKFLLDSDQPWTLMVATSRSDIADRFERKVVLEPRGQ